MGHALRLAHRGDWRNAWDLLPSTVATAWALGCRGLPVAWRAVDAPGMLRGRKAGLELAAFTIRRQATAARLERLGVTAHCVEAAALDGP